MKTGKRWSSWKFVGTVPFWALPVLLATPGCAKDRIAVERNLMLQHRADGGQGVAQAYRLGCPDVVILEIDQRPEFAGRYEIGSDGRINLGDYGKPRLEGRTLPEAITLIAGETGTAPERVRIQVAEFKSQHVVLFGEVNGLQRSVPYRGPETVLDLLQRVGGITPGAAPNDVYVIRPHVGDNQRPEVFHVDLAAIVIKHDHRTNLRVRPYDQIYVGETVRARIEKALPPWLRRPYRWVAPPQTPPLEPLPGGAVNAGDLHKAGD